MATSKSIFEVQNQLHQLGFDPGPSDGIWGRLTITALRAFQKKNGLQVDGILGPESLGVLFKGAVEGQDAPAVELPWMAEATRLIYTKEFLGTRNNPEILRWADNLDIHYSGDEVAWCGLFVGHCIASTLPEEALPVSLLRARAWAKFGQPTQPRYGAVMVFWRLGENSVFGHVGFYVGEDENTYHVLGGNQRNSVCYEQVAKNRLITAQWPSSAESLHHFASVVELDATEDLAADVYPADLPQFVPRGVPQDEAGRSRPDGRQ